MIIKRPDGSTCQGRNKAWLRSITTGLIPLKNKNIYTVPGWYQLWFPNGEEIYIINCC